MTRITVGPKSTEHGRVTKVLLKLKGRSGLAKRSKKVKENEIITLH